MENLNKWQVTLKQDKESIIVLSEINHVSDLVTHFMENVGVRPCSVVKL